MTVADMLDELVRDHLPVADRGLRDELPMTLLAGAVLGFCEASVAYVDAKFADIAPILAGGVMTLMSVALSIVVMSLPLLPLLRASVTDGEAPILRAQLLRVLASHWTNMRVLMASVVATLLLATAAKGAPVASSEYIAAVVPAFALIGLWRCWLLVKEALKILQTVISLIR